MSDEWPMPPMSLVREAMKFCRCCNVCASDTPPCHGALVTGLCDRQRCTCDDEPEPDDDDHEGST